MEFFTVNREKRPVRLCEATRKFAWDSLNHVYGTDTAKNPGVNMDDIEGFSCHPAEDLLIRKAEQYPEEEKCTISEIKLRQ